MTPPGTVNAADQARIVDYLVNFGGNLFMESVNIGTDHFGTDMLDEFGIKLVGDGEPEEVVNITATEESFIENINYEYAGGDSPHYSVDRLTGTDAEPLYTSEDGYDRVFLKNEEDMYKVISSSVVLAALKDGDSLSMKPYLMAEMINYFLGVTTVTDIREAFGIYESFQTSSYPNPFRDRVEIAFSLPESSAVSLQIIDQGGRLIKEFPVQRLSAGDQRITWNGKHHNGSPADGGIYFYRLIANDQVSTGKLILQD